MTVSPFNIDAMNLQEIKDIMKMLIRLANIDHEIINNIQTRVLDIEKLLAELTK